MKSLEKRKERNIKKAFERENQLIPGKLYRYVGPSHCADLFKLPKPTSANQVAGAVVREENFLVYLDSTMYMQGGVWFKMTKVIYNDMVGYLALPENSKEHTTCHRWLYRIRSDNTEIRRKY